MRNGAILFHAAGLIVDGNGYLFFGPSGAGKSTVAKLSDNCILLGDDLIIIKEIDGQFYACATPFNSESHGLKFRNTRAPIKGLYRLYRSTNTVVKEMKSGRAIAEMMASIPSVNRNHDGSIQALRLCSEIVGKIPCYEMHFTKDKLFWNCIHGISQ